MDKEELQVEGEVYRQILGIDGTMGDAQDYVHPFITSDSGGPSCIVCGLSEVYRKHQGEW